MTDNISDKDKQDWNNFINSKDKLPNKDKKFSKKKAFLNAKKLLNLTLKENFEKIHLDTTIRCAKEKSLSLDDVRLRFKELFKVIPKKNLKNL